MKSSEELWTEIKNIKSSDRSCRPRKGFRHWIKYKKLDSSYSRPKGGDIVSTK